MGKLQELRSYINTLVVGREKELDLMLIALIQGGHVLLESAPGSGKTWMAKAFAEAFSGTFRRLQFTPDVLPSDVTGIRFLNPKTQEFELRTGPVVANLLLADEINRATPRTQSSLLEAMEEKQATIDGETIKLPEPFMVLATQNPQEFQQGTFPLPAAQMDRFLFRLVIDYPSFDEELAIIQNFRSGQSNSMHIEPVSTPEDVLAWAKEAGEVVLHQDIERFIVELVRRTREHRATELGLSSRAALAIARAAQGRAFLEGRTFVTPDDVKAVMEPIALHRLHLTAEGMLAQDAAAILHEVMESVPVPVEIG